MPHFRFSCDELGALLGVRSKRVNGGVKADRPKLVKVLADMAAMADMTAWRSERAWLSMQARDLDGQPRASGE